MAGPPCFCGRRSEQPVVRNGERPDPRKSHDQGLTEPDHTRVRFVRVSCGAARAENAGWDVSDRSEAEVGHLCPKSLARQRSAGLSAAHGNLRPAEPPSTPRKDERWLSPSPGPQQRYTAPNRREDPPTVGTCGPSVDGPAGGQSLRELRYATWSRMRWPLTRWPVPSVAPGLVGRCQIASAGVTARRAVAKFPSAVN